MQFNNKKYIWRRIRGFNYQGTVMWRKSLQVLEIDFSIKIDFCSPGMAMKAKRAMFFRNNVWRTQGY